MKYIKRALLTIYSAIKRNGFGGAVGKVIGIMYREGSSGVARRLGILGGNDYKKWIRYYDTVTGRVRKKIRARIGNFSSNPVISVVMPVYNPKREHLIVAIESVRAQIYPHWELCIADDASTDAAIKAILTRYAKRDKRIKLVFREKNGHISVASNSALDLVTGEWVALLDQDDVLAEQALFWVAETINDVPNIGLIFSDEDKITESGERFAPYFKCDWNVDLFYSHNMVSHLGTYRTDLVKTIGGFRVGFEGSQDYDLALRCIERLTRAQIVHIPRVLYHWRAHPGSAATSAEVKPYATQSAIRALNDHFERQQIRAQVQINDYFGYRVRYALPDILPLVSLIIPTRNGLTLLRQCVESILNVTTYPNYEIVIVDNGSDDPAAIQYFSDIQKNNRIRVLHDPRSFNYSALNNAAVAQVQGELIGLVNNDIEVISPDWLSEMVSLALQPGVGAVGAKLLYPDNTVQHAGVVLGYGGVAEHAHKYLPANHPGYAGRARLLQSFSAVTAACLIVRKAIYDAVDGLNETDLPVAFNDVDFCLRVREAGYRNVWTPYAELYHHESATRGREDSPEKRVRADKEMQYLKDRWGDALLTDPAYSPNLTLDSTDFSYAWPPRVKSI